MWAGMTKGEHQRVNIFYEGVKQKFRAAFLLGTLKKFQKTPNLVDKHGKILEKTSLMYALRKQGRMAPLTPLARAICSFL